MTYARRPRAVAASVYRVNSVLVGLACVCSQCARRPTAPTEISEWGMRGIMQFYKQPNDPVGRILRRQHMSRKVQARADQQEEEAALRQLLNPSPALGLLPGSDALLSASLHSSSLLRSQTVLHSTSPPPIDPFVNWVSNEMRTELVKSNPPMQVMRMVPT